MAATEYADIMAAVELVRQAALAVDAATDACHAACGAHDAAAEALRKAREEFSNTRGRLLSLACPDPPTQWRGL